MRTSDIIGRRQTLAETITTDSPQFKAWFGNSKVVDAQGNPLPVYHGTARGDRVGTRFRKARATAGPMSYFTDDPAIASSYAQGKADTSHEPDTDYTNWITITFGRSKVDIVRAWYWLDEAERQTIARQAPHVTRDDEGNIFLDDDTMSGIGAYDRHIRDARGNHLRALVEEWLISGALFNDEDEFRQVLLLAGLKRPFWIADPRMSMPFVYQVFLRIQNPLVSSAIPPNVIDALAKVAAKQRYKHKPDWADQWNKKYTNAKAWITQLMDETESDHSWTLIPDWVTATLQSLGYDGIRDIGGKHGGQDHTVWIPFDEHQVKSALSNKKFDIMNSNIHK